LHLEIRLDGFEDGLPNLSGSLGSWNAAEAEGEVEMDAANRKRRSISRRRTARMAAEKDA